MSLSIASLSCPSRRMFRHSDGSNARKMLPFTARESRIRRRHSEVDSRGLLNTVLSNEQKIEMKAESGLTRC